MQYMKKIILMSTVLLAGLSACEDYNDQFNIDSSLTDVKTGVTIQLASSDYGTIAGMEANKELALSKDPEGQTYVAALDGFGGHRREQVFCRRYGSRMVFACFYRLQISECRYRFAHLGTI